ncbi:hypothetical protein G9A89_010290 [Geosiphon pyriformis]|nr:hypothetical protein G9A89_010290 [Geosiphon pyriformis]
MNSFRALLYTLSVRTTAYDLWDFIGSVGGKTCFIDHNSVSYSCAHCAIVCFNSKSNLVGAMTATPVIKGVGLHWSRLSQALCTVCKCFGHTFLSCQSVKNAVALGNQLRLARIYAKKSVPISRPLAFGDKTWTLVIGVSSVYTFHGAGMSFGFNKIGKPLSLVVDNLESCLVSIKSSFVSLMEQISELAKRLESLMLTVSQSSPEWEDIVMGVDLGEATSDKIDLIVNLMAFSHVVKLEKMLDGLSRSVLSLSAHFDSLALAGVATCNVKGMNIPAKQDDIVHWHKDINNLVSIFTETKLRNKARPWLVDKFDDVCMFSSDLDFGYVGAGVVIVMNRFLARHVYKISEVPGCLLCIRLLFKNKLLVSILGLYTGASLTTQFFQADEINSLIVRAINESSFVILGDNFNEDGSHKCTSFKKCHDLGLINSLGGSSFAKTPTWSNSWGVVKTIDYVFVSSNLVNAIIQCNVFVVSEHFDIDHKAVSVSLSLGEFAASVKFLDLDAIWCVVRKIMTLLANKIFKKRLFKGFDEIFTKNSLKFHKLELLVFRIVKALRKEDAGNFVYLIECWSFVDNVKSSVVQDLVNSGAGSDRICSALFSAKKSYHAFKLTESLKAKEANIRSAIDKRMESFKVNKGHMIRSVLKHLFRKVVLNHLVVNDDLILEPDLVKSKHHQYQPLEYVFDEVFSDVICSIGFDEFFGVVSDLPDSKAADLSMPGSWKEKSVLTNTCPIALIKMARKIFFKIFFDKIFSAYSVFNVLYGANFLVLKGMTTQFSIFAIGSVIEDVLEKDREL